jgi:hypothetical protein
MGNVYKTLAQVNPSAASLTDAYTVPGATSTVVSSVVVANRSASATSFRVSVAVGGAADDPKQYVAYDTVIPGNDVVALSLGMTLATTDKVRVYATLATLSFTLFGEEIS